LAQGGCALEGLRDSGSSLTKMRDSLEAQRLGSLLISYSVTIVPDAAHRRVSWRPSTVLGTSSSAPLPRSPGCLAVSSLRRSYRP
jgi:hypothetical protein